MTIPNCISLFRIFLVPCFAWVFLTASLPEDFTLAAVLLVPLIADGLLQMCTPYESANLRRLVTGLFFGYGLTVLLLTSLGWAYQWGFGFGRTLLVP